MKKPDFDKFIHFIVYNGVGIEIFFAAVFVVCLLLFPFVGVNYDLSEYLPPSSVSRQALDVMEREFGYPGLARIMVEDVSIYEAERIGREIAQLDEVDMVIGPETVSDIYMAGSFADNSLLERYYKDGNALFDVTFKHGESDRRTHDALDEIYGIVGEKGHYSGTAVSKKSIQESVTREVRVAVVLSFFIIFILLALTTSSWFEPVLFLAVMSIAIVINLGSNIIFGTISFFTFSTAAIFQLAVSMDYSIFLLDNYTERINAGMEPKEAMVKAIKSSSSSILASGSTTIVGFLVLCMMSFTVGRDIGLVLAKGIVISLATVLCLMPALIMHSYKLVEKFRHRSFIPNLDFVGNIAHKIRWFVLIGALTLAIPCYFGQDMNAFQFGDDAVGAGPGTLLHADEELINSTFGKSNMLLAIIPNQSVVKERELTEELKDRPYMNYAISLGGTMPRGLPESFLPDRLVKKLRTDDYARIVMSIDSKSESDYAFSCVQDAERIIKESYPDAYVIGITTTTIDIRDTLKRDYSYISIVSILGVAAVVALTFRSAIMAFIVILPIEVAIYFNMTIPYLLGQPIAYIGYIIVSCLQLGATIDYSILVTNNYLHARRRADKKEAARTAVNRSVVSVLTSGSILMTVGLLLAIISTVQGISQIGELTARGTLLSMIMVLALLPALLAAFDRVILNQQKKADARAARRLERAQAALALLAEKKAEFEAARSGNADENGNNDGARGLPPAPDVSGGEQEEPPDGGAIGDKTDKEQAEEAGSNEESIHKV